MMREVQVHLLKQESEKKRKTFPNKIWSLKKSSYLCTRFQKVSSVGWHTFSWIRVGKTTFLLFSLSQERWREKGKMKKNFRKYLEDILKSSYLCIRFLKRTAIVKRAIFEQIYINNTSSTRAGASQINNWKLMIKARRTWVKQKNRQYLFYINR